MHFHSSISFNVDLNFDSNFLINYLDGTDTLEIGNWKMMFICLGWCSTELTSILIDSMEKLRFYFPFTMLKNRLNICNC